MPNVRPRPARLRAACGAVSVSNENEPMRLVYLGTPAMAVPPLEALVDAGHQVALVVTGVDKRRGRGAELSPTPVKVCAERLGIPVSHIVDDVLTTDAELGVVVAFGRLIKPHVLVGLPMVNLHFSLLPRWRGAAPVERALLAGDDMTGVCVMAVEEGLDTGGVYATAEVPIGPTTTADELRRELVAVGTELLVDTLATGLGQPVAQAGRGHLRSQGRARRVAHRLVATRSGDRPPGAARWRVDDVPRGEDEDPRGRAGRGPTGAHGRPAGGQAADVVRRMAQRRPAGARRVVRLMAPPSARQVALSVLGRIERDGAYANLVVGAELERTGLSSADRRFVTDLVYGTTRMRRACDAARRSLHHRPARCRHPDPAPARGVPDRLRRCRDPCRGRGDRRARAKRTRGFVNAVLRKVATTPMVWPGDTARLSYPDWIGALLIDELGTNRRSVRSHA